MILFIYNNILILRKYYFNESQITSLLKVDNNCGRAEIGRQARLRAVWIISMRVRVSPTAPKNLNFKPVWYQNLN